MYAGIDSYRVMCCGMCWRIETQDAKGQQVYCLDDHEFFPANEHFHVQNMYSIYIFCVLLESKSEYPYPPIILNQYQITSVTSCATDRPSS